MPVVSGAGSLIRGFRRNAHHNSTSPVKQITRRQLLGILLISGAVLLAVGFQLLGPGFVSSVHLATPPELADQGMTVSGAKRIAILPMILLTLLTFAGFRLAISPEQEGKSALVKRTSALLVLLAVVMVSILALLVLMSRPPPPLPIAITHAGYTNGPVGTRSAVFTITNRGRRPIARGRSYWIESRSNPGHPATPSFPSLPSTALLQPGQWESVLIPAPAASGDWRVALDCSAYGSRQKLNAWLSRPSAAIVAGRWRSLSITVQRVRSDWVSQ